MITHYLKLFFIAVLIFLITDMLWLGLIAKSFYLDQYKIWLRPSAGELQPLWWATLLVYFFFALGVLVFVLPQAKGSLMNAVIYGGLFGAIIYGIYDFTCLAIFKDWPVGIAFVDLTWGIVLCAWSSALLMKIDDYLKPSNHGNEH